MEPTPPSAGAVTRRILVLFAHPAMQKSRVNRVLVLGIERMEGVTFHDLYEAYPDLDIDVAREQELLLAHDVVVFHFPFFWYSTPAILKEWQDLVLTHGWAYGHEGTALHGKYMTCATTTGGAAAVYRRDAQREHTVRELLVPIEQTAKLCGMVFLSPFVAHGSLRMSQDQIASHAEDYQRFLVALRDDRLDIDAVVDRQLPYVNENLDRVIRGES